MPSEEIDRLYWDNPYYLVPDGKMAAEPFTVIREAMTRSGQVALGRLVMSQRERLVALEPRDKGIIATTLRAREEVREMKQFFSDIPDLKADRDMIAIAEKIIAQKEEDFDPTKFDDRYEDALKELIAEKRKGHKIVRKEAAEPSNVINLMDALKKSLSHSGGKRGEGPARAAKPAQTTRPAGKKPAKRR